MGIGDEYGDGKMAGTYTPRPSAGGKGRYGGSCRNEVISTLAMYNTEQHAIPAQAEVLHYEEVGGQSRGTPRKIIPSSVDLKPESMSGKQGSTGRVVPLMANYFKLKRKPGWSLQQYTVDFSPPEYLVVNRKRILKAQEGLIGVFMYDGHNLVSPCRMEDGEDFVFEAENHNGTPVEIRIRYCLTLEPEDETYIKFFMFFLRKCLYRMNFEVMGQSFFDREAVVKIPERNLELWPGFVFSIRQHEQDILICAEITHKVFRLGSVLSMMQELRGSWNFRKTVEYAVCGTTVMTYYNRKTYVVTGIAWNITPNDTFNWRGSYESYFAYYQTQYSLNITVKNQPLLLARREQDFHKGMKSPEESSSIYLIPEFCQLVGLTDDMRADLPLMELLSSYLCVRPYSRVFALEKFIKAFLDVPENAMDLKNLQLSIDTRLTKFKGRVLPRETIIFAGSNSFLMTDDRAEWAKAFSGRQMLTTVDLERWVILAPQTAAPGVAELIKAITAAAALLGMRIEAPLEVVVLSTGKLLTYTQAAEKVIQRHSGNLQLLFVIFAAENAQIHSAVKKCLTIRFGILSQCFLSKHIRGGELDSVATKVVVEMNAKLGGVPWLVRIPLKKSMILGFDNCHGARGGNGASVGALVSTTSSDFASFFSSTFYYEDQDELSRNLTMHFEKCIRAYEKVNDEFPERIFFYRDGVSDGEIDHALLSELEQIMASLSSLYERNDLAVPRFSYIVVTKKTGSRILTEAVLPDIPLPGTVVDDTITLPNRCDFFLIATAPRQGTLSPCFYTVLHNTQNMEADKIHRLTYKLCHMYFTWFGTISVPAPCQYARKLASSTGLSLGGLPNPNLQHFLHFL